MNLNDNVVIINKFDNDTNSIDNAPLKTQTQFFGINKQTKVFACLLMAFAVLLFFALVSHTSKDASNAQFTLGEMFGIFSDEPGIRIKFDTTLNLLGLFGAYISDLLLNDTIGIWIIGLPIFLFVWGWQLNKIGEISEKIVALTNKYLFFAIIASCIVGSLSNFASLQNIPIEFYGAIGAFIGSIVSKIISPIGSTVLFTILFVVLITKLTNVRQKGFINYVKNFTNQLKLNNITKQINLFFIKVDNVDKKNNDSDTATITFTKDNDGNGEQLDNSAKVMKEEIEEVKTVEPQVTEPLPNIFKSNYQSVGDMIDNSLVFNTIKTNVAIPNTNRNVNPLQTIDDASLKDFKDKIKLKKINDYIPNKDTRQSSNFQSILPPSLIITEIPTEIKSNDYDIEKSIDDNYFTAVASNTSAIQEIPILPNSPTIIDEAVFTFQPSTNIELPKQTIYVPQNVPLPNHSQSEIEQIFPIQIPPEEKVNPIDIEDISFVEEFENKPIKLCIGVDKPATQPKNGNENKQVRDGAIPNFRNPLSVGAHDEKIKYTSPNLDLLDIGKNENFAADEELQRNGRILQEKLQTFKINISNLEVTRGPVVTQYEFIPADGVKINKIEGLADDLAMALKAKSVHIIAPVPEKGTVGIQIPNSNPSIVQFRSVISSNAFVNCKFELPLALGKTVAGEPYITDLAKMPHLLIAGSTGSGKSVGINTIISSLLYKKHPSQLKFVIIDPKKVELTQYARLSNHFLAVSPDLNTEIVTEPQDAITILKAVVLEMEKRYTLLEIGKQRNIKDYNEKVKEGAFKNDLIIDHRELPYIVVIVDELADLMLTAGKEIELPIVRLAQMARAVGIHLIIATQRPSVNVITGIIKANFPARIAYLVAQKVDSRTILDSSGAEALLGNGDMLFNAANQPKAIRIQNPFISTDEVERLCNFIGEQEGYTEPYLLPSTYEAGNGGTYDVASFDPLFREAAELIIEQQMASTSMLQRRMKIGFARAGRIIDELASANVIGPPQGSKPRTVLMESISELERVL